MITPYDRRPGTKVYVLAIFALTTLTFTYSLWIRNPWFGRLSDPTIFPREAWHQWSTGSTIKFARMWYDEGPVSLKFVMLEEPASIEFPTITSRHPYVSYPPGTVFTIYVLAKLFHSPPSATLVMGYNLFCQYLIALLLGWMVLFLLIDYRDSSFPVWMYSLIPPLLYLLTPTQLFYHQQVFFADQAVLLPFAALLFTEVLRDRYHACSNDPKMYVFQALILFYGSITDWLFFCIAAVVWTKRIFENRRQPFFHKWIQPTLIVGLPLMITLGLYFWQIYSIDGFSSLVERFFIRTGYKPDKVGVIISDTPDTRPYLVRFFLSVLAEGRLPFFLMLVFSIPVGWLTVRLRFDRSKTLPVRPIFSFAALAFGPCLLHLLILREHSAHHAFSVQKFWLPLSTVSFCLLPFLGIELWNIFRHSKALLPDRISRRLTQGLTHVVPFILTLAYLAFYHPSFSRSFTTPSSELPVIEHVFSAIDYDDVVFSPNFHVYANPPQPMSSAMKRVYWTQTLPEIKSWLRVHGSIKPDVVLLFRDRIPDEWKSITARYPINRTGNFYSVHIPRNNLPVELSL